MYIYNNISLNFSNNFSIFRQTFRENQNKNFMLNIFFPENTAVYGGITGHRLHYNTAHAI
jgi:hypothetical protein